MRHLMFSLSCAFGLALAAAPAEAEANYLRLMRMSSSITECEECGEWTINHGASCYTCTSGHCNCILGGFTYTPPGGQPTYYDGKWYPGVPIE